MFDRTSSERGDGTVYEERAREEEWVQEKMWRPSHSFAELICYIYIIICCMEGSNIYVRTKELAMEGCRTWREGEIERSEKQERCLSFSRFSSRHIDSSQFTSFLSISLSLFLFLTHRTWTVRSPPLSAKSLKPPSLFLFLFLSLLARLDCVSFPPGLRHIKGRDR